jgi:hypothetical protein
MKIKIPYYIENCGDGSVALRICESLREAKYQDENQDEGFGEPTAEVVEIEVVKNKSYLIKNGKRTHEIT